MQYADILDSAQIRKHINSEIEDVDIYLLKTTDSTNDYIKGLLNEENKNIIIAVAEEQTKGKGSHGCSFYSPKESGIYMSILLSDHYISKSEKNITTKVSLAVCRAIEKYIHQKMQIKWVNDIYYQDRKVGGILTEGIFHPNDTKHCYTIIGIGINIYPPCEGFPDDIKHKAGYILSERIADLRNKLIAEIVNEIIEIRNKPEEDIIKEYKKASCIVEKYVTYRINTISETVFVLDIDNEYCPIIKFGNGKIKHIKYGKIIVN